MSANDWLGIDLRHLAALEAVARTRSFGAAARELGYTQSAVSQQIATLERIVLLLGHADAIVARLDAARADMAALAAGAAGTLRVGIYQSVGARLLPALVRRFREQWPQVGIRVREESSAADLLRLLEHGELDLTFADLPLREGGKLPLIGRRTTDEPERFLAGRVPELNVIFRTDDNGTLGALVAEDLGVAIEPRLVVDPRDRAVKMLPFGSSIPPRTLVLAWHRDRYRSQAAQAFVELARELASP